MLEIIEQGPSVAGQPLSLPYLVVRSDAPLVRGVLRFDYLSLPSGQLIGQPVNRQESAEVAPVDGYTDRYRVTWTSVQDYDPVSYAYLFQLSNSMTGPGAAIVVGRQVTEDSGAGSGPGGSIPPAAYSPTEADVTAAMASAVERDGPLTRLWVDELEVSDYLTSFAGFLRDAARSDLDVSLPGRSARLLIDAPFADGTGSFGIEIDDAPLTTAVGAGTATLRGIQARDQRKAGLLRVLRRKDVVLTYQRWPGQDATGAPGVLRARVRFKEVIDWESLSGGRCLAATLTYSLSDNCWTSDTVSVDLAGGSTSVPGRLAQGTVENERLKVTLRGQGRITDVESGAWFEAVSTGNTTVTMDCTTFELDPPNALDAVAWRGNGTPFRYTPGGQVRWTGTGTATLAGTITHAGPN